VISREIPPLFYTLSPFSMFYKPRSGLCVSRSDIDCVVKSNGGPNQKSFNGGINAWPIGTH